MIRTICRNTMTRWKHSQEFVNGFYREIYLLDVFNDLKGNCSSRVVLSEAKSVNCIFWKFLNFSIKIHTRFMLDSTKNKRLTREFDFQYKIVQMRDYVLRLLFHDVIRRVNDGCYLIVQKSQHIYDSNLIVFHDNAKVFDK